MRNNINPSSPFSKGGGKNKLGIIRERLVLVWNLNHHENKKQTIKRISDGF